MDKHVIVVNAIVEYKGKFLILKRSSSSSIHPGKWAFPGGKIIPGESVIEALKREIKEETSLEIENTKEFISDYIFKRPKGTYTLGLCFLVRAKSDKVNLSRGFSQYSWIKQEELKQYNHIEGLQEELTRAAKLLR